MQNGEVNWFVFAAPAFVGICQFGARLEDRTDRFKVSSLDRFVQLPAVTPSTYALSLVQLPKP